MLQLLLRLELQRLLAGAGGRGEGEAVGLPRFEDLCQPVFSLQLQ